MGGSRARGGERAPGFRETAGEAGVASRRSEESIVDASSVYRDVGRKKKREDIWIVSIVLC